MVGFWCDMESNKRKQYAAEIIRLLMDHFPWEHIHHRQFFFGYGSHFCISEIEERNALVIEYADCKEDAEKGTLEDGDLFCVEEWDLQSMYAAMLREIFGDDGDFDLYELFGHNVMIIDKENGHCYGEIIEIADQEDGEPEESITIELDSGKTRGFYKSELLLLRDCGPA